MIGARRRGLLLLCFALVCGGLAASQVRERERRAEAAVGSLVSVVVAKRELAADRRLRAGDLAVRRVPARFVPPDALGGAGELAGARTAVPVAAGGYLTAGMLGGGSHAGPGPLRAGERAVELAVAGGGALAGAEPGARVDVLVTSRREDGAGRTFVALENVELLGLRAGGDELAAPDAGAGAAPTALATLRVGARQAVYLTAAANLAGEVRLLVRPPGDRRRVGASAVGEGRL
jgi:Flp pilus assembly protein CpaB